MPPTSAAGTARRYALRRVNPFLGVLQVVETGAGRAVSTNGVVWTIEIRAQRPAGWGSVNRDSRQSGYYRYGQWSAANGLVRLPLAPDLDETRFRRATAALTGHLRAALERLPFRLDDSRELWLLDSERHRPLALLASQRPDTAPPVPEPRYWRAAAGAGGVPGQHRYPGSAKLEALVRQRADFNLRKQWVDRQADGSGRPADGGDTMPASAFPPFLLSEDWPRGEPARLVGGYLEWIAPALLTLQHLDGPARERIENCLHRQAVSVEHHWRLYPEVLRPDCLGAARVQSRLPK